MTKKEQCMQVAMDNVGATRQELIQLFHVHVPGISEGGASTYASTVLNELKGNIAEQERLAAIPEETDAEIFDKLHERFTVIDSLATAACEGNIRSLIISGAAGTGKSYTVERAVKIYDPSEQCTKFARGFTRATGLFILLYEYRQSGSVLILDDIDSIYSDEISMNILKAALDTTHERIISWRSEAELTTVDGEVVPNEFEFEGTVIFLTNVNFDAVISKGGKMAPHLEALMSRSLYVDSAMNTTRDYIIRIRQVVQYGMLRNKGISEEDEEVIMTFFEANALHFRELSLRAILKLADLFQVDRDSYEMLARVSLFRPGRV